MDLRATQLYLATISIVKPVNLNQCAEVGRWLNMHYIGALRYNYNHCVYLFQVWLQSRIWRSLLFVIVFRWFILFSCSRRNLCSCLLSFLSCWELQGQLCSSTKSWRGTGWLSPVKNIDKLLLHLFLKAGPKVQHSQSFRPVNTNFLPLDAP